jgi:Tfp pilus assembly protein PilF
MTTGGHPGTTPGKDRDRFEPGSPAISWGIQFLAAGHVEAAEETLRHEGEQGNRAGWVFLAAIRRSMHDLVGARSAYGRAHDHPLAATDEAAAAREAYGWEMMSTGEMDEALRHFDAALSQLTADMRLRAAVEYGLLRATNYPVRPGRSGRKDRGAPERRAR